MLPGRHDGDLFSRLELQDLPCESEWDGSIAFIDRDGVLNVGSENYINNVEELQVLTGAGKAVGDLRRNGFRICVTTNQSPIGRGLWDHQRLREIHDELQSRLLVEDEDARLDLILYSPHLPWAGSPFRKPNPGMLMAGRQLVESKGTITKFDSSAVFEEARSAMVGDRRCDLRAGKEYGIRSFYSPQHLGLASVVERVLNPSDTGDEVSSAPQ